MSAKRENKCGYFLKASRLQRVRGRDARGPSTSLEHSLPAFRFAPDPLGDSVLRIPCRSYTARNPH